MERIQWEWQESANMAYTHNAEEIVKNKEFFFEVNQAEKDYIESHMKELDEWCEEHFGEEPHTVRFEDSWNGVEKCFDCECYFDNPSLPLKS